MRTDVTVLGPHGPCDVAVVAAAGTRLGEVDSQLRSVAGATAADAWRVGNTPLGAAARVGRDLRTGMVLELGAPRDEARSLLHVVVSCGADAGASVDLARGPVLVGRADDCDLVLSDPSVSRRHLSIRSDGRSVLVRDLESANGTHVGGRSVIGEVPLTDDELIRVGDTVLRVADGLYRTPLPLPARTIDWPAQPVPASSTRFGWLAAIIGLFAAGVLALVLRNPQLLIFMLVSPLAMSATAIAERTSGRRTRRLAATEHANAISTAQTALEHGLRDERRRRHADLPDPHEFAAMLAGRAGSRAAARPAIVRVGLADQPAALTISHDGVLSSAGALHLVPVRVDLARAAVRIDGPPRLVRELAYWIVLQLVAQDPVQVELVLRLAPTRSADWEWARWLRHRHVDTFDPSHSPPGGAGVFVIVDEHVAHPSLQGGRLVHVEIRHSSNATDDVVTIAPAADANRLVVRSANDVVDDVIADHVQAGRAEDLARLLCVADDVRPSGAGSVPTSCRLLDLLGPHCASSDGIRERWAGRDSGTAAIVGVGASGVVRVDLARDGPHALVAGTTGSGKSELLRTWVVSLAASYPPDELSFVLVDYKGGAAFADCAGLPHVSAVVTDLEASTAVRMLRSLDAELTRRERLFATSRVADLDAYRAGVPPQSLARLVVMIDEFAALALEHADFISGLVSIAQRGRSLGVHLVLATQRPGGVVSPEIRANTSLRIGLRMTDAGESRDVIGDASAAQLTADAPGCAVVSCTSTTSLVQFASVSAAFDLHDHPHVVALGPWRTLPLDDPPVPRTTDLHALVHAIRDAAAAESRLPAACPWLPPLPALLRTDELPEIDDAWQIPVGLADHPAQQRRETVVVDLGAGVTVGILGSARSGRTTTLVSLAIAGCSRLPPDDFVLYLLDGDAGGLSAVASLPHVASCAAWRDADQLARLVLRLAEHVAERRSYLHGMGYDSIREARHGGRRVPSALVLIDGWDACVRALDDHDGGESSSALLGLIRAGPSVGVSVVVAGDRELLAGRVAGSLVTRYALRLADRGDYALIGVPPGAVGHDVPPGRGVRAADAAPVQFAHAGWSAGLDAAREVAAQVAAASWMPTTQAVPRVVVRALPTHVRLAELPRVTGRFVLGIGGDAAEPVSIDLIGSRARMVVCGPPGSGRTSAVRQVLQQAVHAGVHAVLLAPEHSRACADARAHGVLVVTPSQPRGDLPAQVQLVLVDDAEAFAGTPAEDALLALLLDASAGSAFLVAASNADVAVAHRGIVAEVRRSRTGLALCPRPSDGEPFGVRLPRRNTELAPGRGVLIGGPRAGAHLGTAPVRIQVAMPDEIRTCAGIGDRSAERKSP